MQRSMNLPPVCVEETNVVANRALGSNMRFWRESLLGRRCGFGEHSPAFAGVGYDGFDGDDVVIVERGEDGDDGAFNVVDGVIVGVANVDGVGIVGVVGLTEEEDKGATADGHFDEAYTFERDLQFELEFLMECNILKCFSNLLGYTFEVQ
ncbi:hypothetical protein ACSQ67_011787 [Phaseolus vulgaris]